MITVRPFNLWEDMGHLLECLVLNGAYEPSPDEMPEVGFVALHDGVPTAYGFLRRIEGGSAILDGLATDPRQPKKARHLALDSIMKRCVEAARALKIKHLIGISVNDSTLSRSLALGFEKLPHTLVVIDLNRKV